MSYWLLTARKVLQGEGEPLAKHAEVNIVIGRQTPAYWLRCQLQALERTRLAASELRIPKPSLIGVVLLNAIEIELAEAYALAPVMDTVHWTTHEPWAHEL